MSRRFQFSLRWLLVVTAIAAAIAARMHYSRENEIHRALSHLRGIERLQAKLSPVQPTLQGKHVVDSLQADHERWEKRLKELRGC